MNKKTLATDMANADRLVLFHADDLKFVRDGGGWKYWNGLIWEDGRDQVMEISKEVVRSIPVEAAQISVSGNKVLADELWAWGKKSQQLERLRAMIKLSESDEKITEKIAKFDTDPMLLACRNCVIDLHSGTPRQAMASDMISVSIPVSYDSAATCPTWTEFLNQVLGQDQELIDFIQKAVGYSLTGSLSEQCLFFLFGHGRNGKSTFISTITELFGELHKRTAADTLMLKKQGGGIPNDLAALVAARMVSVSEIGEGMRLDEGKIKDLTGGDMISARFLHGEFFNFKPKFKLWLAGNYKPRIVGTDEGIWRRLRLIPFSITIEKEKIDPELPDKLLEELPGILNWAVTGTMKWQVSGMTPPPAVLSATKEYRTSSDVIGEWLEECIDDKDFTARTPAKNIRESYEDWARENGYQPLSSRRLNEQLIERNFCRERKMSGYVWRGLEIKANDFI